VAGERLVIEDLLDVEVSKLQESHGGGLDALLR
jgi:hypothetical protein